MSREENIPKISAYFVDFFSFKNALSRAANEYERDDHPTGQGAERLKIFRTVLNELPKGANPSEFDFITLVILLCNLFEFSSSIVFARRVSQSLLQGTICDWGDNHTGKLDSCCLTLNTINNMTKKMQAIAVNDAFSYVELNKSATLTFFFFILFNRIRDETQGPTRERVADEIKRLSGILEPSGFSFLYRCRTALRLLLWKSPTARRCGRYSDPVANDVELVRRI